jgi:hypothetical protein
VILTNAQGGIWLVHSVPHFPLLSASGYNYPHTGLANGQLFLCLSLNLSQVDGIGDVLSYTRPNFFGSSLPPPLSSLLPKLSKVVRKGAWRRAGPWFKRFHLYAGGLNFSVFAKGPKFQQGSISNTCTAFHIFCGILSGFQFCGGFAVFGGFVAFRRLLSFSVFWRLFIFLPVFLNFGHFLWFFGSF